MPNGWEPTTAEEMFADIYQRLRIQARHRHTKDFGEIDAIDGSSGVDISPTSDSYTEGEEQYLPTPEPPALGDQPPDGEDVSPVPTDFDIIGIGSEPLGSAYVYCDTDSFTATGSDLGLGSVTWGTITDRYVSTAGRSRVDPSQWINIIDDFPTLSPGWYEVIYWLSITWAVEANSPPSFGPYVVGVNGVAINDWDFVPRAQVGAGPNRYGVYKTRNCGMVYAEGDNNQLVPGCFMPVVAGAAATSARLGFSVTKWS